MLNRKIFRIGKKSTNDTKEAALTEESGDAGGEGGHERKRGTRFAKAVSWVMGIALGGILAMMLLCIFGVILVYPKLPSIDELSKYRPTEPLRIYTADNALIGEFGMERRIPLTFDQIPDVMKNALLATEDARFYDHHGVDVVGLVRAVVADVLHGGKSEGASTITMQLARNFFLSHHKTLLRKLYEILLAIKIESVLNKQKILEIYMNQIYLGERSYGFGAAAHAYFGKDLKDISVGEAATLAGLPKAPSAWNPVQNPARAKIRQEYVLKRMLDLHYIGNAQYRSALQEKPYVPRDKSTSPVHAAYVAEMVRQMMVEKYGEAAYERGYRVWTTVTVSDQTAAYDAVHRGVTDYDARHGYRGPEAYIPAGSVVGGPATERLAAISNALKDRPAVAGLEAAVVVSAAPSRIVVQTADRTISVTGKGLRMIDRIAKYNHKRVGEIRAGAIVRVTCDANGFCSIGQIPDVEAALVSLNPQDGAIRALVGGFDSGFNKFNHVTQGWRQPGSSFKPYVYSASLEKGIAPATIVDDDEFQAIGSNGRAWRPKEEGALLGPITVREALTKSKNLVALRVLDFIGPEYAKDFIVDRFGLDSDKLVANLPMVLGAGAVTPLQMAVGYAVFANGGYRISPYLVNRIEDGNGAAVFKASPLQAGLDATPVISKANSFIMTSMLQSAAQHGTGSLTNIIGRTDLAGKTGTTNDYRDGWFAGFQHSLVAVSWMGFDKPQTLGEYASRTAVPIWVDYVKKVLLGVPGFSEPPPDDVVVVDGEFYEAGHVPGSDFVSHIGDSQANQTAPRADVGEARGNPAHRSGNDNSVAPVDRDERQQILDHFIE
ncbi:penicillin-binding protein 1A [Burkholderia territorii]|uniref:penicillin-binding protein 1A n=1 Tax=Burkholderia territorii TaxID=1503055 RepID=UPI0009C16D49|nr:PBP1A family penicillin-binding protein [Burkholderia territorii]